VIFITFDNDFRHSQFFLMNFFDNMKNVFLKKIQEGTPIVGTLVTMDAPEVAEILSLCGFDWLFLDMEHGNLSLQSVLRMSQAIGDRCAKLVRIPANDPMWIQKVLDIGAEGIIVPRINSKAQAEQVVQYARYPPEGKRGAGIGRAHGYGVSFDAYMAAANAETAIIIQIEDIEAVHNLDTILEVPGISGVLIGPYDLSGSMNMLGEVTSPPVQAVIATIRQKCQEKNIPVGMFTMQPEAARQELAAGCSFVAVGLDSAMLIARANVILQTAKR
jgi:2-dehydro-3-deoxyglucarate aldolase/4-hydroxy-2-oxoheptanedioate aldolase